MNATTEAFEANPEAHAVLTKMAQQLVTHAARITNVNHEVSVAALLLAAVSGVVSLNDGSDPDYKRDFLNECAELFDHYTSEDNTLTN